MLNRVPNQVEWTETGSDGRFPLLTAASKDSGISCTVFSLGSRYPPYVSRRQSASLTPEEALLGVVAVSASGARVAYMPAVPAVDDSLLQRLADADLLLFDGTFWSEDELIRVQGSGSTAREMGHIPVSGAEGSLRKLAGLRHPRKVFVHINNTNPMLDESGREYAEVRAAGWEVAEDGWSLDL
jgi:pyrroloquinoline quinone biosynthesis protein B